MSVDPEDHDAVAERLLEECAHHDQEFQWLKQRVGKLEDALRDLLDQTDPEKTSAGQMLTHEEAQQFHRLLADNEPSFCDEGPWGPGTYSESNGEAGDFNEVCNGCQRPVSDPHTWHQCVGILLEAEETMTDNAIDLAQRLEVAESDRDALLEALGKIPGPLREGVHRQVLLDDARLRLPEMVRARKQALDDRTQLQIMHYERGELLRTVKTLAAQGNKRALLTLELLFEDPCTPVDHSDTVRGLLDLNERLWDLFSTASSTSSTDFRLVQLGANRRIKERS